LEINAFLFRSTPLFWLTQPRNQDPAWSAKVEYQYLNFGRNDICGSGNGCFSDPANAGSQKDDDYHTVRLGLNYHFVPAYGPLK
jgi:hypothetical protein